MSSYCVVSVIRFKLELGKVHEFRTGAEAMAQPVRDVDMQLPNLHAVMAPLANVKDRWT